MRHKAYTSAGLFLALGILVVRTGGPPPASWGRSTPAESSRARSRPPQPAPAGIRARLATLPLSFEENRGQTNPRVRFLARGRGYTVFFTPQEIILARASSGDDARAALRLIFLGANLSPRITGMDELPGKTNYFIGRDPHRWQTNISRFARVGYEEMYPGVNGVFYGSTEGLEYDLIVAPGADLQKIQFTIEGAERVALDFWGDLRIRAAGDEAILRRPEIYQLLSGRRVPIAGGYVVRGKNRVGFRVGEYDRTRPLILDPALLYATFLGGSDAELAGGVAVDSSGFIYVAGSTKSVDFPTQPKVTKSGGTGNFDVFVAKFDPSKSGAASLIYSTFLGGSKDDQAFGVGVDGNGEAYVAGVTASADYPVQNAFQPLLRGATDIFVTKLNASGSGMAFSTFFGGNQTEGNAKLGGLVVDTPGNAYVSSDTESGDLFTSSGAFQGGLRAPSAANAFVVKFSPTGSVPYSTYLGGSGTDSATGVAFDGAGMIYVAGFTSSMDFPVSNQCSTLSGSFAGGANDGFVTKLNPAGSGAAQLIYSTYLGGSDDDRARAIAVDNANPPSAYIAGDTRSANFPATSGAFKTALQGGLDAFVSILGINPSGKVCLTYSTYLGGAMGDDSAHGVAINGFRKIYVTGRTTSTDFPVQNSIQPALNGASDAFFAKLDPAATGAASLLYSTFLGGKGEETGEAMAVDTQGNAFIAGETTSSDFPTTPASAFQTGCASCAGGVADVFLAKLNDNNAGPAVSLDPTSAIFGNVNVGVTDVPVNISLKNSGTATLTNISIAISGNSDFTQSNNCASSLPATLSCQITANFTPTAPGSEMAAVNVMDSASDSPQTISLTGNGVAPLAAVAPMNFDFGNRPIGTMSAGVTVTLTNSGSAPLAIALINIGGGNSGDFSPSSDSCPVSPGTLGAGMLCIVQVVFTPKGIGPRNAHLDFTDNSNFHTGTIQSILLSGTGTLPAPVAALSPTSHDFGAVNVGTATGATTFTMTNSGNLTLHISSFQITGNGDYAFANAPNPACPTAGASTLASNMNCNVAATFKPSAQGPDAAQIVVTDDSGNVAGNTQTGSLTGAGAAPVASVSPSSNSFSGQLVGTSSAATAVMLKNTGTGQLSFQATPGGTNAGDFTEADICAGIVNSGATCNLMVTFVPKAAGARSGMLIITDNSGGVANSQQTVALAGTATDFAIQAASGGSASATVKAGQSTTYNLQMMPANGFTGAVTLACTGAPSQATCTPSASSVTVSGTSAVTFQMSVTTAAASLSPPPVLPGAWLTVALLLVAVALVSVWAILWRPRRWLLAPAALLFLAFPACSTGGGGGITNPGTPAGSYTLTVTGSQQSASRTLNLTLQVQ